MKLILAATIGALFASAAHDDHNKYAVDGLMAFNPIASSAYGHENDADIATAPWIIPEGFSQAIVSDERSLDIYVGNDWTGSIAEFISGVDTGVSVPL